MSRNQLNLEEKFISSIEENNLDKLKQFLSSGYHINSYLRSRNKIWDTNCFTILAIASFSGSKTIVEFLISNNAHINQTDYVNGRTALHWAVASGHYEISKLLVEAGARVNALDRDSVSPLILAANYGDLEIVKMLIKHGALVSQTDRMNSSALHYACMRFHADIARELIQHGCIRNTNTPFSFCSPLKYLLFDRQYAIARILVESGSDLSTEKWLLDPSMSQHFPETKQDKQLIDLHFINWIRAYRQNPPKLMNLCRFKIRTHLGSTYLEKKINALNIPTYLKGYLMIKF